MERLNLLKVKTINLSLLNTPKIIVCHKYSGNVYLLTKLIIIIESIANNKPSVVFYYRYALCFIRGETIGIII